MFKILHMNNTEGQNEHKTNFRIMLIVYVDNCVAMTGITMWNVGGISSIMLLRISRGMDSVRMCNCYKQKRQTTRQET